MLKTSCRALLVVAMSIAFSGCVPVVLEQASEQPALGNTSRDFNYEVQPGDRLTDIALALTGDISNWETIASYNNVTEPKTLAAGTILQIPGKLRGDSESVDNLSTSPDYVAVAGNQRPLSIDTGTGASVDSNTALAGSATPDVFLYTVKVNRSFDKTPMDAPMISRFGKLNARVQASEVRIVGTYYPVGIYAEPVLSARLVKRVAPGSIFALNAKINDWYEITTDEGAGYIRQSDGTLVK